MQLVLGFGRKGFRKCYRYHSRIHNRYFIATGSWLKSLNSKLQYTQLQKLAIDESLTSKENQHPRLVQDALFTKVDPTPLQSPKLLSISSAVKDCIDLDINAQNDELSEIFSGNIELINKLIPDCTPYSHCYCGHQFGNFAGQLGDGRAICLGEYVNDKNERWEIQLKGAGLTPYSRFADGRAVLRSSIREYLISEAMHYLGVPTTRAGLLVSSDQDKVIRDEFYNGNAQKESTAIVTRLSPSFIRFGSFEICSKKGGPSYNKYDQNAGKELLKPLLDYVIEYHYNKIWQKAQYDSRIDSLNDQEMYEEWWKELVEKTIQLVVKWQCLGFVHGVLNTDNMSIIGLTIDYGPFGFVEYFNDEFVPNYSDHHSRYCYKAQPEICLWNLDQLAIALDDANILPYNIAKKYISKKRYIQLFIDEYRQNMKYKFGLIQTEGIDNDDMEEILDDITESFFDTLKKTGCDFNNAFRALNMISITAIQNDGNRDMENEKLIKYLVSQCATPLQYGLLKEKHKSGQMISLQRSLPNLRKMADLLKQNPEMNSLAGLTLKDIEEVLDHFDNQNVANEMTNTDKEEHDTNAWKLWVEKYRATVDKQIKKSKLDPKDANNLRIKSMNANNPKYILRNYMLQKCIDDAENGDYEELKRLLKLIKDPYNEQPEFEKNDYDKPAPDWAVTDCVSCSS